MITRPCEITITVTADSVEHANQVLNTMEEAAAQLDSSLIGYSVTDDAGREVLA